MAFSGHKVVSIQASDPEVGEAGQHAPLVPCVFDAAKAQFLQLEGADDIARPEGDLAEADQSASAEP